MQKKKQKKVKKKLSVKANICINAFNVPITAIVDIIFLSFSLVYLFLLFSIIILLCCVFCFFFLFYFLLYCIRLWLWMNRLCTTLTYVQAREWLFYRNNNNDNRRTREETKNERNIYCQIEIKAVLTICFFSLCFLFIIFIFSPTDRMMILYNR